MIVIVNANNGKIELTPEEFKKYLEEARQEGYDEGYRLGSANVIRYPVYVHNNGYKWWDDAITWTATTPTSDRAVFVNDATTGSTTVKEQNYVYHRSIECKW